MNSRITWPPYLKPESGNLAYYLASLLKFSYCYEFACYLASFLNVVVWKSCVLLGHFIKILILLRISALLGHLQMSQSPEISRITWPLYKNSCTPTKPRITWPPYLKPEFGNLAYYLATLRKLSYSSEFALYFAVLL